MYENYELYVVIGGLVCENLVYVYVFFFNILLNVDLLFVLDYKNIG